jgi:5-methylcytosine-specific restriction endonuclease McrA
MSAPTRYRTCPEPGCPNVIGPGSPCPSHSWLRRSPSSRATAKSAYRRIRLRVLARDNYVCRWCGGVADQVDHLTPVAHGGGDQEANLVASCGLCNNRRNAR